MKILLAPDSFKGSLSAVQFCEIAEKAILSIFPEARVTKFPLADGGEGTVEALALNAGGRIVHEKVSGPLGEPINAYYGILGDGTTGVIEMAAASGLALIPPDQRNPLYTTTYGVGELMLKAIGQGCRKIIIGLGGSATNDGGAGVMQALGFQLLDKHGNSIKRGAEGLLELEEIRRGSNNEKLNRVQVITACDVDNPLLGKNGATYTYALQKGSRIDQLSLLEQCLDRYHQVIKKDLHKSVADIPGAGAAGGMGAGLMAFLNATLKSGFEIISELSQLESRLRKTGFDFIITGEGCIDGQTAYGKLPVGMGKLGKKYDIPVIAIVGGIGKDAELVYKNGISTVFSIMEKPMGLKEAIENVDALLYRAVQRIMKLVSVL